MIRPHVICQVWKTKHTQARVTDDMEKQAIPCTAGVNILKCNLAPWTNILTVRILYFLCVCISFNSGIPFLEIYLTNEFALVQNKASLYLLIFTDQEWLWRYFKWKMQFTKNRIFFFCLLTKERTANICIDYVWKDTPDLDNCFRGFFFLFFVPLTSNFGSNCYFLFVYCPGVELGGWWQGW